MFYESRINFDNEYELFLPATHLHNHLRNTLKTRLSKEHATLLAWIFLCLFTTWIKNALFGSKHYISKYSHIGSTPIYRINIFPVTFLF